MVAVRPRLWRPICRIRYRRFARQIERDVRLLQRPRKPLSLGGEGLTGIAINVGWTRCTSDTII